MNRPDTISRGIAWIDEHVRPGALDTESLALTGEVALLAYLFGEPRHVIAGRVVRLRRKAKRQRAVEWVRQQAENGGAR